MKLNFEHYYTSIIDRDLLRSLVGNNRLDNCFYLKEAYIDQNSKKCNYRIHSNELIGVGGGGEVYEACCEDEKDCKYVAKILSFTPNRCYQSIFYQQKASRQGLAPPIHEVWVCQEEQTIVAIMDKMDITFEKYLDSLETEKKLEAIKKFSEEVVKLHKLGIVHGDLKFNNVMINESSGDIKFIDFEYSADLSDNNKSEDFEYIMDSIDDIRTIDRRTRNEAKKIVRSILE